jgi:hypothetical protein
MSMLEEIITYLFFPPKKVEPTIALVDYMGLQDPPTPRFTAREIDEQKLTCFGARVDNGLAEYIDLRGTFEHILTIGRTGVGKSVYFRSTFLYRWISHFPESSVVIFDAMDGVIEDAITLCEKARPHPRPYIVLPDAGMNILNCSDDPHVIASNLAQAYMQQADKSGGYFNNIACSWILVVIPLIMATYPGKKPTLLDLRSLASDKIVRQWLVEDARDIAEDMPELFKYLEAFDGDGKKAEELTYNLNGFSTYLRQITSGKFEWMLSQRDAPSLTSLLNDPQRPVIILRVGDFEGSVKHILGILGISMVSAFVMSRDLEQNDHPCLFYIDEGGLMTQTSSDVTPKNIASMLQTARKRRCGFVIGIQTLEQVPEAFRETFIAGCRTAILQQDSPASNAKYFAEMIGNATYRITYPTEAVDPDGKKRVQVSSQDKVDYIMSPDRIRNILRDEVIVLTPYNSAKRTPLHLKRPYLAIEPTPYHEPKAPKTCPKPSGRKWGTISRGWTMGNRKKDQPKHRWQLFCKKQIRYCNNIKEKSQSD